MREHDFKIISGPYDLMTEAVAIFTDSLPIVFGSRWLFSRIRSTQFSSCGFSFDAFAEGEAQKAGCCPPVAVFTDSPPAMFCSAVAVFADPSNVFLRGIFFDAFAQS